MPSNMSNSRHLKTSGSVELSSLGRSVAIYIAAQVCSKQDALEMSSPFLSLMFIGFLAFASAEVPKSSSRDSYQKSLWPSSFVYFPQEKCTFNSETGYCMQRAKCKPAGGMELGMCAMGYGVCCKFKVQCGGSANGVSVTKPVATLTTPTNGPKSCSFNFPRQKDVCQIRLEFDKFELEQPDPAGNCNNDYMLITGSVTVNNLVVCGNIPNNETLFLDYGTNDEISVTLKTSRTVQDSSGTTGYGYNVIATQIPCNSPKRVPANCLQYKTRSSGQARSFNYPRQQINNQNYRVCVEKPDGNSYLQWSACDNEGYRLPASLANPNSFCIVGGPNCSAPISLTEGTCSTDFINIPDYGLLCTSPFPYTLTSRVFDMWVKFDESEPLTTPGDYTVAPVGGMCPTSPPTNLPFRYEPYQLDSTGSLCVARPVVKYPDIGNLGFCLKYNVVSSNSMLGRGTPPPI